MSEDEDGCLSALASLLSDDDEPVYDSLGEDDQETGEEPQKDDTGSMQARSEESDKEGTDKEEAQAPNEQASELEELRKQVELLKGQLSQQTQSVSLQDQMIAKRHRLQEEGQNLLRNKAVKRPIVFPSDQPIAEGIIKLPSDFDPPAAPLPRNGANSGVKKQRMDVPGEFFSAPTLTTSTALGDMQTGPAPDEFTEKYSKVRLKPGRKVSVHDLDERLKQARIVTLAGVAAAATITGDWVCFGVIASKSEPKPTAKGGHFLILKLTDLRMGGMTMVSVFLFGKAFDTYWKENPGLLVCIANAKILPRTDAFKGLALSISSAQQLCIIGEAADFDYCAGYQKGSMVRCQNPVAKAGGFCQYHVKAQYMRMAAGRMDINRSLDRAFTVGLHNGMPRNLSAGSYKVGHMNESGNPLAPKPAPTRLPKNSKFSCKELLDLHSKTSQSYRLQMGIQDKETAEKQAKEQLLGIRGLKAPPAAPAPDRKMSGYDYMLQKQASQAFHEAKQRQKLQEALAEAQGVVPEPPRKIPRVASAALKSLAASILPSSLPTSTAKPSPLVSSHASKPSSVASPTKPRSSSLASISPSKPSPKPSPPPASSPTPSVKETTNSSPTKISTAKPLVSKGPPLSPSVKSATLSAQPKIPIRSSTPATSPASKHTPNTTSKQATSDSSVPPTTSQQSSSSLTSPSTCSCSSSSSVPSASSTCSSLSLGTSSLIPSQASSSSCCSACRSSSSSPCSSCSACSSLATSHSLSSLCLSPALSNLSSLSLTLPDSSHCTSAASSRATPHPSPPSHEAASLPSTISTLSRSSSLLMSADDPKADTSPEPTTSTPVLMKPSSQTVTIEECASVARPQVPTSNETVAAAPPARSATESVSTKLNAGVDTAKKLTVSSKKDTILFVDDPKALTLGPSSSELHLKSPLVRKPSLPFGKDNTLITAKKPCDVLTIEPSIAPAPAASRRTLSDSPSTSLPKPLSSSKPSPKQTLPTKPSPALPPKSTKPARVVPSRAPDLYLKQPVGVHIPTRHRPGELPEAQRELQRKAEYFERQQRASALLATANEMQARALRELRAVNGGRFPAADPNCTSSPSPRSKGRLPAPDPNCTQNSFQGALKASGEANLTQSSLTLEDALKSPEDTLEEAFRRGQGLELEPPKPKVTKSATVTAVKKKMTDMFGLVDMGSEAGKKLLEARSIHSHLADATHRLQRQELFDVMEKKEEMLEQMAATRSVMAPAFECLKCHLVSPCFPPVCRDRGHEIRKIQAKKRFFQCDHCKQKTTTLNLRLPNEVCPHCRKKEWVPTGMMTLGAEKPANQQLLVRGEEHAFSLRD